MSVFVGQSGVGKSTLVNRLVPDAFRATGDVSKIGKGRHTSSSVVLFDLPGGGTVIDTPGIRSFGLAHVTADDVLAAFDEIAEVAVDCPPLCGHTAADPECALDAWAAAGPPARQAAAGRAPGAARRRRPGRPRLLRPGGDHAGRRRNGRAAERELVVHRLVDRLDPHVVARARASARRSPR